MGVVPTKVVTPPDPTPAKFGLFSAVEWLDNSEWHGEPLEIPYIEGDYQIGVGSYEEPCISYEQSFQDTAYNSSTFEPMLVEVSVKLSLTNTCRESLETTLINDLIAKEEPSIMRNFLRNLRGNSPKLAELPIQSAISRAENYLVRSGYGKGVILIPRLYEGYLRNYKVEGSQLYTLGGCRVAFYEPATESRDSFPNIYGLPPLIGYRSDIEVFDENSKSLDLSRNNVTFLARRAVVIGYSGEFMQFTPTSLK